MPILIVRQGNQKNQFVLKNNVTTIGRSPDNTLPLNDTKLLRYHCQIIKNAEGYKLMDLGAGGISVNTQKVKERLLQNEDIIKVGDGEIVFFMNETTANAQSRPAPQVKNQIPINNISQQKSTETARRGSTSHSQAVQTAAPKTDTTSVKKGISQEKTNAVIAPSKIRQPSSTYSKPMRPSKLSAKNEEQFRTKSKSKNKLLIGGAGAIAVLIIILLIVALSQSPGKKKAGDYTQEEVLKAYKDIQKEAQGNKYEKALGLAGDFIEKYKKSNYLSEVQKLVLDLKIRQREAEAMEAWNQLKKKSDAAGSDETSIIISEVKSFLTKYSGTKAVEDAQGELDTLKRLVAQESPALKKFNEVRMNIEKNFVAKKKYDEGIKEYEKFLNECKDDSIITGEVQKEIGKLKEKMK